MTESPRAMDWAYRSLTPTEAERHYRDRLQTEEKRLARFRAAVESRRGPVLDGSRESLAGLGSWILRALHDGPRKGEVPLWSKRPAPRLEAALDDESLWLLDGLGTYLAACLRGRHAQLAWRLVSDRLDIQYQQPVLSGFDKFQAFAPPQAVVPSALRARKQELPDTGWLLKVFDVYDERVAPASARPTSDELPIDDVEVTVIEGDPAWDVEIWIPEYAEQRLGEAEMQRLPQRLQEIGGIEQLAWEDRERFLARLAKGADIELIQEGVAAAMRDADAAAEGGP